MNNVAYFEIQATEPERAIAFYNTLFGWNFEKQDGMPIAYWRIKTEGMNGGLMQRPAEAPASGQGTNAFTCSVQVTDFDSMATTILKSGGSVALEKFYVPGVCWQGYFLDTEKNVFGLFQVDESTR